MDRTRGLVVLACFVSLGSGCGEASDRGAVRGRVSVNGVPLASGDISFVSVGPAAVPSSGAAIVQGEYEISAEQGPMAGQYQVQIRAFRGTGRMIWDGNGDERAPASQKKYVETTAQFIPAKYNDASVLKAEIVAGQVNELNFELQAPPAKGQAESAK
jgi:hypothetical protein